MGWPWFRKRCWWIGRRICIEWEMRACWSRSQSAKTACGQESGSGCSILSNQDWIAGFLVRPSWGCLHWQAASSARNLLEADKRRTTLWSTEIRLQMIYMEHEWHQKDSQPRKWDYKLSSPVTRWDVSTGWPSAIIRGGSRGLVVKAEGFWKIPHPERHLRIHLVSAFPPAALSWPVCSAWHL